MTLDDINDLRRRIDRHKNQAATLRREAGVVEKSRKSEGVEDVAVRRIGVVICTDRNDYGRPTTTARDEAFARVWAEHRHDLLRTVEMDLHLQARREFVRAALLQAQLDTILAAVSDVAGEVA